MMRRVFLSCLVVAVAALTIGCVSVQSGTFRTAPGAGGGGSYGTSGGSNGTGGAYGPGDNSFYGGGLPERGSSGRATIAPDPSPTPPRRNHCEPPPPRELPSADTEETGNADSSASVAVNSGGTSGLTSKTWGGKDSKDKDSSSSEAEADEESKSGEEPKSDEEPTDDETPAGKS